MPALDNIFGIHAAALKLREQRMAVLGSNIANASTPGYKARDIDFSSALKLAENGQSTQSAMRFRVPIQASLDGNTVEMATEQGASLSDIVKAINKLNVSPGDLVAILEALSQAGALSAELVVI